MACAALAFTVFSGVFVKDSDNNIFYTFFCNNFLLDRKLERHFDRFQLGRDGSYVDKKSKHGKGLKESISLITSLAWASPQELTQLWM